MTIPKSSHKILIFFSILNIQALLAQDISVMTYNIRLDVASDGINQWSNRKEKIISQIKYYSPDIFGLQEALFHQLEYVSENLPDYEWYGVGRDDGKKAGEFSPIFFNKRLFEKEKNGTFWLAEDITKPGKGWDAALPRIASWVQLRNRKTGKQFIVYNTHFDHVGKMARTESFKLIANQAKANATSMPAIIMGDLNTVPEEESIAGFKQTQIWQDAFEVAKIKHGPTCTFNGFSPVHPERRIDYIFCNQDFEVKSYLSISEIYDGVFPSDHWPVLASLRFKK
ncbi:MAG: endonuclease/exonuclease/phosphatase family protein [Saprospiraceae bacterium]|nr:endonuclease/exonuclease/phosphatase family protein [Saprospiraceae bacterium]